MVCGGKIIPPLFFIPNKEGNVLGMMPHACELLLGSMDGNLIWEPIIDYL
jgi:phosphoribosylformylglycinamidine (FGAM) synthase-like amidotransferase family enzyme